MKKRLINYLIGFFVLFILIQSGLLIYQNNKLKSQIKTLKTSAPHLLIEENAPQIKAIDLNGKEENINFSTINKKILFFIFSPSCVPCEKNFVFWQRLNLKLKEKVHAMAIIIGELDDVKLLKQAKKIRFPLYIPKEKDKFISNYRISNFSQTILIDEKGKIQWIKAGNLDGDDYNRIKELALR
ncbi:MAG: redoxin domain-containing protein [Acidobacteriota bacterium]